MVIEVSDLYDAFHLIAQTIWSTGEFEYLSADSRDREKNKRERKLNRIGSRFDELVDALEYDFFFTGCARRVFKRTGIEVPLDEIATKLRIHNSDGNILTGEAKSYHSHAFDWPREEDKIIIHAVISGEMWPPQYRPQIRLFVHI